MPSMNYQIIATLGPSSSTEKMWKKMLTAGVSGFRLNTSHLSHPELLAWLEKLHPFLSSSGTNLTLDLQGSKWRLGKFQSFELHEGNVIEFINSDSTTKSGILPIPHQDFFQACNYIFTVDPINNHSRDVVMNDNKILLKLKSADLSRVTAVVKTGGEISAYKGVNVSSDFRFEEFSDKDRAVVMATRNLSFVNFAISYVKNSSELEKVKNIFRHPVYLITKLERQSALDDAVNLSAVSDELWLCRGDLGSELGLSDMAQSVFAFSKKIKQIRKPVYLAGQVLEHMTEHMNPTRSEISYLYEALERGFKGIVLSDETAIGRYPVESCQIASMFRI